MARFTDEKGKAIIEGSLIKRYGITYTVKEIEGKLGYFIDDVHYGWVDFDCNSFEIVGKEINNLKD